MSWLTWYYSFRCRAYRSNESGTDVAPSSSGLGRHPLKVKIVGSNPTGVTTQTSDHMGMWCRGLTCDPVKVETAGSNPVIPATEPPMYPHRWFSFTPQKRTCRNLLLSLTASRSLFPPCNCRFYDPTNPSAAVMCRSSRRNAPGRTGRHAGDGAD